MAEEKNYMLPLIAMVAIVAIVGLVMMFMNKGTATYATTTPEVQYATQIESENVAGEARAIYISGDYIACSIIGRGGPSNAYFDKAMNYCLNHGCSCIEQLDI